MATVLNRNTKVLRVSVHTPDYPTLNWIHDPDLSAVAGQPPKYWKITGDTVSLMSAGEQATVNAAELESYHQQLEDFIDDTSPQGLYNRLLFKEINKLRVKNGDAEYTVAQFKSAMRQEGGG